MKKTTVSLLAAAFAAAVSLAQAATLAEWNFENAKLKANTDIAPSATDKDVVVGNLSEFFANGSDDAKAHAAKSNTFGVRAKPLAKNKCESSLNPDGKFLAISYAAVPQISRTERNKPAHGYFIEFTVKAKSGSLSLDKLSFLHGVDLNKDRKQHSSVKVFVSVDGGKSWTSVVCFNDKDFVGFSMSRLEDQGYIFDNRNVSLSGFKELKNIPGGKTVKIAIGFGDGAKEGGTKAHLIDNIKLTGSVGQ